MNDTKVFLIYCTENQDVAEDLTNDLGRVGIQFVHDTLQSADRVRMESVYLASGNEPIFLLISDNFLKSETCMGSVLPLVENPRLKPRIRIVVMDGKQRVAGQNTYENVPTKFDRLSDVVNYINFWSDKYQDLRTQIRHAAHSDLPALNTQLEIVQNISNQIFGDFMRYLRSARKVDFKDFKANNFKLFFNELQAGSKFQDDYRYLPIYIPPVRIIETPELPVEPSLSNEDEFTQLAEQLDETVMLDDVDSDQLEQEFDTNDLLLDDNQPTTEQPTTTDLSSSEDDTLNQLFDEIADEVVEEMDLVWENGAPESDDTAANNVFVEQEMDSPPTTVSEGQPQEEEDDDDDDDKQEEQENEWEETEETDRKEEEEDEDEADDYMSSDELEDFEPSALDLKLFAIQELLDDGDFEAAKAAYEALLEEDSSQPEVHYEYAVLMFNQFEDKEIARKHLEIASELNPNDEDILFNLGEIAEEFEDFDAAKNYYERVILIDLDHESAYYRLGALLANEFEDQEFVASSYLQRAISLDEELAEAHFEYAKLLFYYFKKDKKAIKHLKKAIQYSDEFANAYFELAKVYHHQDKPHKAIKAYISAFEADATLRTVENDDFFGYIEPVQEEEKQEETPFQLEPTAKIAKTVFVTGATSGIGQAVVEIFAQNGFRIIASGRRTDRLEALKTDLETRFNAEIHTFELDVRQKDAVFQAVENLPEGWQQIDILVNNAGLAKGLSAIHEGDLDHWETMIDTNIKGLLFVTRAISPQMVARRSGHIINIGSIAGKDVYPKGNVYCATKFAVDALNKSMRLDLHPHNIRVTAVNPGYVETEFSLVRFDGDAEKAAIYNDFTPLIAADVADAVFYAATRPDHVNLDEILITPIQQGSVNFTDKSGRK